MIKVKATATIIDWDADASRSVVINCGETGEISEKLAKVHEGSWERSDEESDAEHADLPQLDHDGDGHPGGSLPDAPPSLHGKNKAQLLEIAVEEGVDANPEMTNPAIVKAIEDARAAAADAPPA